MYNSQSLENEKELRSEASCTRAFTTNQGRRNPPFYTCMRAMYLNWDPLPYIINQISESLFSHVHPLCMKEITFFTPYKKVCRLPPLDNPDFGGAMGRVGYLATRTQQAEMEDLIISDVDEIKVAVKRLIAHAATLGGLGLGTSFLKWLSSFAAIYLLVLDRTNWRTNMLASLLVPYIFVTLPHSVFHFLRRDTGKCVAFIAVILRLFFNKHFPDWLEIPGSMILLLVVSPKFLAHSLRDSWMGVAISLFIGCYLLQEHIRTTGGFRNSFTYSHGISNTLGLIILLVYPISALLLHFF